MPESAVDPTKPVSPERPNASAKPATAVDAVSKKGDDAKEQDADVGSDRSADDSPAKKAPLTINEIEALEGDVEGG
jgi:hypothetical protein